MKDIFLKHFLICALILGSTTHILHAQNVGGTNSNQSTPKEVKAAELSKGAYTSDVNLFTGTMSTSYDLGTVSTFSGLSYNLQLNYSTTKTVGNNPSIVRGISYGDGWNVNIPSISVSVDAYRNINGMANQGNNCTLLDIAQSRAEGSLAWFAPYISIPGVVSERFVLKTIDTLRNELVFVPNVMDHYVEARLKYGSSWEVTNHNGDVYSFDIAMTNYRTGPQLNYPDTTRRKSVGVRNNNLIPKEEPISWYCNYIYNKNSPLNQQIAFQYEGFGTFNFYKEFMQPTLNQELGMAVGNQLGLNSFMVSRDILLVGVESYSDRGSIEKLELNYKTVLPPSSAKNMLSLSEASVKRLDSLNNYRIVFSQGVDNALDSVSIHSYGFNSGLNFNFGLNQPSQGFSGWNRFMHVMSAVPQGIFKSPNNPYLFSDNSADGTYRYTGVSSSAGNSELKFNHGFLESPRIIYDIIPGDIYEVKSFIKDYNVTTNAQLKLCNFDINVVSGIGNNGSGGVVAASNFISGSRGFNIFSTFGNPVKWTSLAHNIIGSQQPPNTYNGLIATSNFFLMPAMPQTFGGINVQIGPANSDHDFALDLQSTANHHIPANQPNSTPSAYDAYKYLQSNQPNGDSYSTDCLNSPYSKPPHNFGIGMPWLMMNKVYTGLTNDPTHENQIFSGNYNFWWKNLNTPTSPNVTNYSNVPTAADNQVALAAFEIVRYSKNPYMLTSVKKYKYNGYNYTDSVQKNKYLVNQLNLGYGFKVDSLFSYVYSPQTVTILSDTTIGCNTYYVNNSSTITIDKLLRKDFIGFQNVYLLETIKQIPVNGALANAPTTFVEANLPTTHFYYSKMSSDNLVGKGTRLNFTGNIYLVNKIVDQLGGTMKYDYYPLSDGRHTRFTDIYVDNAPIPQIDYFNLPKPNTYKVQIVVKEKKYFNSSTATIPLKIWQYEYSDDPTLTNCNDGIPVLGKNTIPHVPSQYTHNQQNIDFGFLVATIKYPQLNTSTGLVPYDRYTHFSAAENRNLTFGKLKKVEKFDAAGQILSKKEFEYKATMAFGNFLFTGATVVSDYFNENDREYTSDYNPTWPNYAIAPGNIRNYYTEHAIMDFTEGEMSFLEMANMSIFQNYGNAHTYPNCYFVRLVKETNTDYDYTNVRGGGVELATNPLFRGINLGNVTNAGQEIDALSGINSLKLETSRLVSADPSLIMRQAIPFQTRNELTTITEYEYWDADSLGISQCFGFEQLLNQDANVQGSTGIFFEPSFELYKTKTYSPHLQGAFTSTENYYYWDLKEDIKTSNPLVIYNDPNDFDALNYTHKYEIRNLMYQKTVTSKAASQPAIAKSEYYWYDTRTIADTVFYYDTLYIDFDYCQPPSPSDTLDDNPWTPDPTPFDPTTIGCYQVPHPFQLPQPGFGFSEVSPGEWWYCPINDGTSFERRSGNNNGSVARYRNLPSDMKTKLMLRRIDEQIDTIKTDLTTYYHKYHPILRFNELYTSAYSGGPLNVPLREYGWYLPYKTKTKYKTLEHTILGQVRLDMNERGLFTKYDYQTIFSTTFIDLTGPPCPTNAGGAYNLSDQGVPKCITVGYNLQDALTTCYSYNKDYTINSITDPNGMVLNYSYDNFSRMNAAFRNGQMLSFNQYSQWMNDTTLTYEQRADQNYVESYVLLNNGSTIAEHSRAYIDPLGRKYDVLTQVTPNYTNPLIFDTLMIHSGLTTYDNWDRVEKQYKPFKQINGGSAVPFSPQFNPTANFTEQQYENNQRGRVLRASKFGENINTGHTVNSSYQIITGTQLQNELVASLGNINIYEIAGNNQNQLPFQRYLKTSTIDEDSKKTISYTNAFGQKVATKTYAKSTGQEVTGFVYNSQGLLKKVINPKLQKTTYEYNLSGNMFRKVSVDADTVKYLYDVSGNVVLEQDANGKHGKYELDDKLFMRKYTYDIFGRMIQQDRVHYNTIYDPLRYQPFVHGYFSNLSDTNKVFYQFTNTATLDFYGGWIVEKCNTGGLIYRQTQPTGGDIGPVNPFDPGFNPDPTGPNNPPANPCSMVYGNINDSLKLSAPEKKWAYHFQVDATDAEISSNTLSSAGIQNHLNGRLSMAKSYRHDGTFSNLNIYSYNNVGLMEKEITQFNHIAGTNIYTSIINYTNYNLRNSLVEQEIDTDADGIADITYKYIYDGWNRLRIVKQKQGGNSFTNLASYNYDDALGLIANTKYYNPMISCNPLVDSISYKYDTRNRLTRLNSKLYSERLFYDANIPTALTSAFTPISSRNYNGNINGLIHNYKLYTTTNYVATAGIMDSSTIYGYRYDGLNRLLNADASVLNVLNYSAGASVYNPRKSFGDEDMTYDAIGNIVTLDRGLYYNSSTPTPTNHKQNWNYSYPATNNHLLHVDSVNTTPLRQYNYDNNGNQNSDLVNNKLSTVSYMRSNLPSNVLIDHDITTNGDNTNVNYEYNNSDDRVYKNVSLFRDIKETYYLRDATGKEVAEYDVTNNNWKYYAYGRERIAEIDRNYIHYFSYDHLGSIKIVYSTDNTCTPNAVAYTIESASDLMSFGKQIRTFNNNQKFCYQGSEKDQELSDNDYYTHFRGLDVEKGRWKQIDPKMELQMSWSPYVSMNNNPIMMTDQLGDVVHAADWQTRKYLIRQFFTNQSARQILWSQMRDRKDIDVTRKDNTVVTVGSRKQHYYYKLNENSNATFGDALQGHSDWRENTADKPHQNYHWERFNVNKSENIHKVGQGNDGQKNITGETKASSESSYQRGTIDISFTPNSKDVGGDKLDIYTIIGNTHVPLGNSPYRLTNDPSNPAGYNNFSFPFDFGEGREHIYFKVTDNDDLKSSKPGAFDLKININGF